MSFLGLVLVRVVWQLWGGMSVFLLCLRVVFVSVGSALLRVRGRFHLSRLGVLLVCWKVEVCLECRLRLVLLGGALCC